MSQHQPDQVGNEAPEPDPPAATSVNVPLPKKGPKRPKTTGKSLTLGALVLLLLGALPSAQRMVSDIASIVGKLQAIATPIKKPKEPRNDVPPNQQASSSSVDQPVSKPRAIEHKAQLRATPVVEKGIHIDTNFGPIYM